MKSIGLGAESRCEVMVATKVFETWKQERKKEAKGEKVRRGPPP